MNVQNINNSQYKQNELYHNIIAQGVGVAGGYVAKSAITGTIKTASFPLGYKIATNARSVNYADNEILLSAFDDMLTKSGLKDKGIKVHLFNISALNNADIRKRCKKALEYDEQLKPTINNKLLRDMFVADRVKDPLYSHIVGVNAGYDRINNIINFADNYITPAAHEAGHAIINNAKSIGKAIDNLRTFVAAKRIVPAAIIVGLLTRHHKEESGKPLTKLQRAENTIHNNLGFIAGSLTLPCLINEAQASFIAEKYMKPVLPKNLFKKVVKSNRLGLATYLISAIATGVGAAGAVKVKDNISAKIKSHFKDAKTA